VSAALTAGGAWIAPQPAPQSALIWLAPLLCFVAAGALLALALGSWVASGTILGVLWLGELFLHALVFLPNRWLREGYLFLTLSTVPGGEVPNATYWLSNRLTLCALAGLCIAILLLLLRRPESLLRQEG
jgi:hypothetical protein